MTERQWFGVAVRCAAIFCFIQSLAHFLYFLDMRLGLSSFSASATPSVPTGYITYVAVYAVSGLVTLRSAEWIVAFAYDREQVPPESSLAGNDTRDSEQEG